MHPGTHTDCSVTTRIIEDTGQRSEPEFESAFFCYGIMDKIVSNCLPLIFLDACHLKGPVQGVICVASVVTGNNDTIVVGVSINYCNECESCWTRFIQKLLRALPSDMAVMSDRDKGLRNACADLLPYMPHSFCAQHIKRNVKRNTKVDAGTRVIRLAKAKRAIRAELVWKEVDDFSADMGTYLRTIGDHNWISASFPSRRYGIVTSNPVESSNAWLEVARHKDPFNCIVTISDRLMGRLSRLRAKYGRVYDARTVCQHAADIVKTNIMQRRLRAVLASSNTLFKVSAADGGSRVADLEAKTCTCLKWDEFELPCVHLCSITLPPFYWCSGVLKRSNFVHLALLSLLNDQRVVRRLDPPNRHITSR